MNGWHPLRALLLATTALAPAGLVPTYANPLGVLGGPGQVVGGAATVQGTGTATVSVTQSTPNAIVNWSSFNIGKGETTQFIQPSASSTILNRVIGDTNPS